MTDLLERAASLEDAMVDAVQALVTVESPSDDIPSCEAIVLEAIGVFSGWLPVPARIERHGGRPVWRWGADAPRILLLGHLDTVWPLGTLERIPFQRDGDRLRGPGVFDMKAGVVQAWAAMALAECDDEAVGMLLTTDEEIGSPTTREVIAQASSRADAVLVFEPSIEGALKTRRKGTSWYSWTFTGRASHAGLDPERGVNALTAAADLVRDAEPWGDPACGTTVVPTVMSAGTTANTVPACATLTFDVRAWTREEQVRVDEQMRSWRARHPDIGVIIEGGIDRPALEEKMSLPLFERAASIARDVGLDDLQGRAVGGASDGNLTAAAGHPTLDGLGAVGDGAHADHEWVSVRGMVERAALVAGLLVDLRGGTEH